MLSEGNGAIEIEMDDYNPFDDQPLVHEKSNKITTTKFGRMFKFYETNWQCPGISASLCCQLLAIVAAAIGITSLVLASSQMNLSIQITYYVVGGIGCGIAVLALADSVIHCVSCTAIGHYVPERAFESNIGRYHKKNLELNEANKDLRGEADRLSKLLGNFKALTADHEKTSEKLNEILGKRTTELNNVSEELKNSILKLDQAEKAMKEFEDQLNNLKNILIKLGETNKDFKEYLAGMNLGNDVLKDKQLEWSEDLQDFSHGNNQYERLNNQANQLGTVLNQQLELISVYRDSIEKSIQQGIKGAHAIDDSDDKLRDAAIAFNNSLMLKESEKLELQKENESLQESLNSIFVVLKNLEKDPDLKRHILKIIQAVEDASEPTASDPEMSEQEVSEKDGLS